MQQVIELFFKVYFFVKAFEIQDPVMYLLPRPVCITNEPETYLYPCELLQKHFPEEPNQARYMKQNSKESPCKSLEIK